jgi:hypothetical protein
MSRRTLCSPEGPPAEAAFPEEDLHLPKLPHESRKLRGDDILQMITIEARIKHKIVAVTNAGREITRGRQSGNG